jgi:hypothetical protein
MYLVVLSIMQEYSSEPIAGAMSCKRDPNYCAKGKS